MPAPIHTKIPITSLGLPGLPESVRIVPRFDNDSRTDEERLRDIQPRIFKLQALLSKFPPNTQDIHGSFTKEEGSSFVLAIAEAEKYRLEKDGQVVEVFKNADGELSLMEYQCESSSFEEAYNTFFSKANPWIDYISYSANCPIYLSQLRSEDIKNEVIYISYLGPYQNSYLNSSLFPIFPELEPVYALYREAKNTNSLFYRFLSYFKIMEGFKTKMRNEINIRATAANISPSKDLLPDAAYINPLYKKYVGGSVWKIYDEVFNPEFRLAVAHYMKENGDIMTISDITHQEKYTVILPVIELCVRALIEKYNQLLIQLTQASK